MWFLRKKKKRHKGLAGGMLLAPAHIEESWPHTLKQLGYRVEEEIIPPNPKLSLPEALVIRIVKGDSRVELHKGSTRSEVINIIIREFPKDYPLAAEIEEHLVKAGCTRYFGGIAKYESSWRELTSNDDHKSGE